ncbi:unnamed protein product [Rotaria sordida]|uniref:Uncharacterized protein n=1 Tax=Rotaria sordida TaxID=392033 RepID=A0A818R7J8_9BILA|nr:unnamed protein product [Rotaria sordida]CAF3653196.1 unnamed protein product [Rotaria sordida]
MLWYALVVTLLLVIRNGQAEETKIIDGNDGIRSISSGLSYGKCGGYCSQSINITKVPSELVALKGPNGDRVQYPPIQRKFCFNSVEWQELIALLDLEKFKMLDEIQGCPGCADGGIEWIQVDWSKESKRVTFEYEALIADIEELIKYWRVLREKYFKYL